ncbi:hypothetical protein [Enterococcus gallinarum]|uniref:hypothetical protein n=1 Tax=Enterococcus gallinarum TaxID=1353 RepID=UPI0035DF06C4
MTDNDNTLIGILSEKGPLVSTELVEELNNLKINNVLGRKWIQRACSRGSILKVKGLSFKHNQQLYYLKGQENRLKKKILDSIEKYDELSQRLITALIENKFLFLEEALKIIGAPINKCPTKNFEESRRVYREVVNGLQEKQIISVINSEQVDEYIKLNAEYIESSINSNELEERRVKLQLSKKILCDMLEILERTGFLGWNSSRVTNLNENTLDVFNNYYFDALGFSYTYDNFYIKNGNKKGMPVLLDILLYRQTKMFDVVGKKITADNVKSKFRSNDNRKVTPIILVSSIEREALRFARNTGIVVINVRDIIGNNNLDIIKKVLQMKPREMDISSFEDYFRLISLDGRFNNVRGILFNYMVAQLLSKFVGSDLRIGKEYKIEKDKHNKKCECDIVLETIDTIFIFETKGYRKATQIKLGKDQEEKDSVKKFFERTRDIVHKANYNKPVVPIFITSSSFEDEALNYLQRQKKVKNIFVRNAAWNTFLDGELYIDRDKLVSLAKQHKCTDIKKIIDEYFQ